MTDTTHPSAEGIAGALRAAGHSESRPIPGGTRWFSTGYHVSPHPDIPGAHVVVHRRRGKATPAVVQAELAGYVDVLTSAGFTAGVDPAYPRAYVTPPAPDGQS